MELKQVADILLNYGPAGAAVVLMFYAERKLRNKWNEAQGKDRKICAWLYTGNWIFVASLIALLSVSYFLDKKITKINMAGIVQDLHSGYRINDSKKELYTRTKLKNNWLSDVHWHSLNTEVPQYIEIRLELEKTADFYDFQIPVQQVSNLMDIHILYKNNKLCLKEGSDIIELKIVNSAAGELKKIAPITGAAGFSFPRLAYAQNAVDNRHVLAAMGSEDSYLRQSASNYLVQNIETLNAWIEDLLLSGELSKLQSASLLTALGRASSPDVRKNDDWKLSENAERVIFSLIFDEDNVIAAQSLRYIIRNVTKTHLEWLSQRCTAPLRTDNNRSYCAYIGLQLHYNAGISLWAKADHENYESVETDLLNAITVMDNGKKYIDRSDKEVNAQFPKLVYGRGFLYHELAKTHMKNGHTALSIVTQRKAIIAFKELLYLAKQNENIEYQYPHHLKQAKCYIDNTSQECLDNNPPQTVTPLFNFFQRDQNE